MPIYKDIRLLEKLPNETVITPHYLEFSKIFDIDVDKVTADPISACLYVKKYFKKGKILILKGPISIIMFYSEKDRLFKLNLLNHGTSFLANAGSGDILSGIVAGLAINNNIKTASIVGSYIHSELSQLQYSKGLFDFSLESLINQIPSILKEYYAL